MSIDTIQRLDFLFEVYKARDADSNISGACDSSSGSAALSLSGTVTVIVTDFSDVHPLSTDTPASTSRGKTTDFNDEQSWKAPGPIVVTLLGMVTEVSDEQP